MKTVIKEEGIELAHEMQRYLDQAKAGDEPAIYTISLLATALLKFIDATPDNKLKRLSPAEFSKRMALAFIEAGSEAYDAIINIVEEGEEKCTIRKH